MEAASTGPMPARRRFTADEFERLAEVGIQNPIRLDDFNEPQPDVSVMRPRDDAYGHAHPGPDDLLLVIEVAHTSQRYDRGFKAPLYGRYGVPETWVVDLEAGCVHVFREPSQDGYRVRSRHVRDEELAPQAFPDLELRVADILGPPPAAED